MALRVREAEEALQELSQRHHRWVEGLQEVARGGTSKTGRDLRVPWANVVVDIVSGLTGALQAAMYAQHPGALELKRLAQRGAAAEASFPETLIPNEGPLGQAAVGAGPTVSKSEWTIPLRMGIRPLGLLGMRFASQPPEPARRREIEAFVHQAAQILFAQTLDLELGDARLETVKALGRATEAKDPVTFTHLERTRRLVRAMAEALQLPEIWIGHLEQGAYLHDIGKIGTPDAILNKPGPLTPEEYAVIKQHPVIGEKILSASPAMAPAGLIVRFHQEWFNGEGYPDGLAGAEIPLGARIVQVLDAWDAMTSNRPYRKAMPRAAAAAELLRMAGTQFDPHLVEVFLRLVEQLEEQGISTTEVRQTASMVNG